MAQAQSTRYLLMTAPKAFHANPQTLGTNAFQHANPQTEGLEALQAMALAEFMALHQKLVQSGVVVTVVQGTDQTPDDVFCNNWVSTHAGMVITYPLLAENRRLERREDVLKFLVHTKGVHHSLNHLEKKNQTLESTGSLVLDHVHKIAYAALSERTTPDALMEWAELTGYEVITFQAKGPDGQPVYHTNVLMFIGTGYAGICLERIVPEDRSRVADKLAEHHAVLVLSVEQINQFCGNCLEVLGEENKRYLVMSAAAEKAFTPEQKNELLNYVTGFICADLSTIEHYGGGSARCMLLEVF